MKGIITYLFLFHSTFGLSKGRQKFHLFNSTYYNFLTGKVLNFFQFKTVFIPRYYYPMIDIVEENTSSHDIISSNLGVFSQIFSALTQRPSSKSMFHEVRPAKDLYYYKQSKLIIWLKPLIHEEARELVGIRWKKIYDFMDILLNP